MASEVAVLHAKVAKLLSRRFRKPVLQPKLPLVVSDSVSCQKDKSTEASCVSEMSLLMACWKQNSFSDTVCSNEIKMFYECVTQSQAARKAGVADVHPGGMLPAVKVNQLLRKFPNIKREI